MVKKEILIVIIATALVCASEAEDVEQKKRGAGKGSSLNAIPTGAQKPDYTYSIYSQNQQSPSYQTQPQTYQTQPPSYQPQLSNSFYPTQTTQQYYTQNEPSTYPAQPQLNLIPPQSPSQFLPINFVPNPGYQQKYQLIPSKAQNGNVQLLLQPSFSSPILQYPQQLFSGHPQQLAQGTFNVPNIQPFSFGSPFLGQPSMLLALQPNSLYNNLVYPNPVQNLYNYYPSQGARYQIPYASAGQASTDYEKLQGAPQSVIKDENDVNAHNSDYITPSESSYKNSYVPSRSSSYTKLT